LVADGVTYTLGRRDDENKALWGKSWLDWVL
jgi:hypothetical protein